MSRSAVRILACLVALCTTRAFAGPLSADATAIAGFHGTTPYQAYDLNNLPTGLFGTIDFAVWAPGTFPAGFSGFLANDYVYAYQVREIGPEFLSSLSVVLNGPADAPNIGDFTGNNGFGAVDGFPSIVAQAIPLDSANWYFNGIGPGNSSDGLAFSSPQGPIFSRGSSIGDGSVAFFLPIPGTSPINVPEPGTLALAGIALSLLALRGRLRVGRRA